MKKVIKNIPQLLVAAIFSLMISCNGAQTHDDTNRVDDDRSGVNHPDASDTTMTDTTRNVTTGTPDSMKK